MTDSISTEDFEAALDSALFKAMTEGVPLIVKGEPVFDNNEELVMVTPGSDILSVAERRAKAKRSGQGSSGEAETDAIKALAEATAKAREQGGVLPDMKDGEDISA